MNIFCVIDGRLPTEKAYGIQVMELCEAFSKAGNKVVLLFPRRFNYIKQNPFKYYQVEPIFKIVRLPTIDFLPIKIGFLHKLIYLIQAFTFGISTLIYILFKSGKDDIFYSCSSIPLFLISFARPRIFFEEHDFHGKWKIYGLFYKRVKGIVATNQWKTDKLAELFNYPKEKILCYPNAVKIEKFAVNLNKEEARRKLNLPLDKKIIMYTGHLFSWKGVDTLMLAAKYLPKEAEIYFVGGMPADQERLKKLAADNNISNFTMLPHQPREKMPIFLKAADVLAVVNTAKEEISKFYTGGPLKLTEYMSSERPVVAPDIPSIRNIVNETNVLFFEPDNPKSLARAAERILNDKPLAEKLVKKARNDIEYYSWENRIKAILDFIQTLI